MLQRSARSRAYYALSLCSVVKLELLKFAVEVEDKIRLMDTILYNNASVIAIPSAVYRRCSQDLPY